MKFIQKMKIWWDEFKLKLRVQLELWLSYWVAKKDDTVASLQDLMSGNHRFLIFWLHLRKAKGAWFQMKYKKNFGYFSYVKLTKEIPLNSIHIARYESGERSEDLPGLESLDISDLGALNSNLLYQSAPTKYKKVIREALESSSDYAKLVKKYGDNYFLIWFSLEEINSGQHLQTSVTNESREPNDADYALTGR